MRRNSWMQKSHRPSVVELWAIAMTKALSPLSALMICLLLCEQTKLSGPRCAALMTRLLGRLEMSFSIFEIITIRDCGLGRILHPREGKHCGADASVASFSKSRELCCSYV